MQKRSLVLLLLVVSAALLVGCSNNYIKSDNLALDQEYFASSAWETRDDMTAVSAFDGDNQTRWSAAKAQATNQYIGVNFGEEIEYCLVEVYQGKYPRIVKCVLQYSNDGIIFTDISGTEREYTWNNTESEMTFSFEPITSQYLRLFIYESVEADKGSNALKEPSIEEIKVYFVTEVDATE